MQGRTESRIEGKRVIVTGGAGFIGSHLVQELVRLGSKVVVVDDLSTGRAQNIAMLLKEGAVRFVQGSVVALRLLKETFAGADYVFHLAAIPSVPRSMDDPLASHEANLTGTLNVLIASRHNRVKKVIYSSSSSVYGDTPVLPKQEDMVPNPMSPYAVTKLAGECYCRAFQESFGLPTVSLRYFNVYGPRQDPNSEYAAVVPRFLTRASQGNPPIIFGDGEQTRDFTFVKDAVEANILAAESDATGVFNIGTGESITINRLAELIIRLVESNIKPVHQAPRPGDIRHSLADISRARTFGYQPKYGLEEGISETLRSSQQTPQPR